MQLTTRFEEAAIYALRLHAKQFRKGTRIPYAAHLFSVASIALRHGADEDEAIAALLHDAVEDQGGAATLAEIRRRFGDKVAAIVEGCTDTDQIPKPPWRKRKEDYIAHVRHASPSVRLVSASDKLDNARAIFDDYCDLGEALWKRFSGGKDGTLWYYRELVKVFREAGGGPLVDELDRVVRDLERRADA
jgi:(p)ppGpp synthase/HD superfamily hydrolase